MSDTPLGTPEMQGTIAPNETVQETTFSHKCFSCDPAVFILDPVREAEAFREILKWVEERARDYVAKIKEYNLPIHDKGEVIADAMLALRHIEDARMRYGKCIQYATTGESSFQK